MSASSTPAPSHGPDPDGTFLGLELAPDQLRAVLLDSAQELVGTWVVDFDECDRGDEGWGYGIRGGMYTGTTAGSGEAYTAPVEMWVRALDLLFARMAGTPPNTHGQSSTYSLNSPPYASHSPSPYQSSTYGTTSPIPSIRAISGCALPSLVWWKSTPLPALHSLDPSLPLSTWFNASAFSLPNTSVRGGPGERVRDVMARVAGGYQREAWVRTGRVQAASKFVESLVSGRWAGMGEAEAWASGMYDAGKGKWDEEVLDAVGGSREEGRRVRGWLGEVHPANAQAQVVSRYLCERYGFRTDTLVHPFTLDVLATYAGMCPAQGDAVLAFGPTDTLIAEVSPTATLPSPSNAEIVLLPHPFQLPHASSPPRLLALLQSPNADVARALVRDMYTKSWSAFDRLVAIVPPGGSIGLDDKLFAYWDRLPSVTRFEGGVVVNEFRDLRANPRCAVESQVVGMRVRWGRCAGWGWFEGMECYLDEHNREVKPPPSLGGASVTGVPGSMTLPPALPFDPIQSPLPARLLCTGAAANFPSIANVLCDVFGRRVYVGMSQIDSAQISPHRNAPARGFPGRAALGSALVARWAWGVGRGEVSGTIKEDDIIPPRGPFEASVHSVHEKRWERSGGTWARTNVSPPTASHQPSSQNLNQGPGQGHYSGGSTPTHTQSYYQQGYQQGGGIGMTGYGGYSGGSTPTGLSALGAQGGILGGPPQQQQQQHAEDVTPAGTTALVPISALPIIYPSDAAQTHPHPDVGDLDLAQAGLARVADADRDAFLCYASLVGEWVRLEGVCARSQGHGGTQSAGGHGHTHGHHGHGVGVGGGGGGRR